MDNKLKFTIGSRIKQAREKSGKTQKEVATMLGFKTPSIISEFESGKKDITASDLGKLAELLGVSINFIFGVEEAPATKLKSIALEELQIIEDVREFDEVDHNILNQLRERNKNKNKNLFSFSS